MRTEVTYSLNDREMRAAYHRKRLRQFHVNPAAVVVDELGLQHGKCRADIAVVNGHLAGYEIKSDLDSLTRLYSQVDGYSAVFDRVTLVVTERHLQQATELIPKWWGLVSTHRGSRGGIHFDTVRRARRNPQVDDFCVAQLLWREEVKDILAGLGVEEKQLRGNRAELYGLLVSRLKARDLRECVRARMKSRLDWRCPSQLSPGDDSSPPSAM